jgi:hypothetical protein
MDLRAEQLMFAASDIQKSLGLSPNQQTLWQQTLSKTRVLMHARQLRRDKLQAVLKLRLGEPQSELRDLAVMIDEEADVSAGENKQLRELWLTVNDALDDNQRKIVMSFLLDRLERSDAPERGPGADRRQDSPGGMGRQKPGGMGGNRF